MKHTLSKSLRPVFALSVLCLLLSAVSASASTKVGNGGDIVDKFLANTRYLLSQVLADIVNSQEAGAVCSSIARLNDDEKRFCNAAFAASVIELKRRVDARPPVPFRLSMQRLKIVLPDGTERPVLARTECGPEGEIVFDYVGIKGLSPAEMASLMAHEFMHKISFEGRTCLQDSDTPGPFTDVEGGRRLIDAMAEALTRVGIRNGKVGEDFGIVDQFICEISEPSSGLFFPSQPKTNRVFLAEKELGKYMAGVGILPRDSECAIGEDFGRSKVTFRLRVYEHANCDNQSFLEGRITQWELVREFARTNNAPAPDPVVLAQASLPGVNPLCAWAQQPLEFSTSFTTNDGRVFQFKLRYANSSAIQVGN